MIIRAHWFCFILALLPILGFSQFTDDFSDGDFTNIYLWEGDDANYIINSSNQLQLNDTAAGTSQLRTQYILGSLDSIEWHFYIKESFSPSNNNYAKVYLASDQQDLTGSLNGYYLRFGENLSNDAIELFEQSGTSSSSICRATDGAISSSWEAHVRVRRDQLGNWELAADYTGGTNYVVEATGNNSVHTSMDYLGVQANYTKSYATNFYFDNFYIGPIPLDTFPPVVSSVSATSDTTLDVFYNEVVSKATAEILANYSADNGLGSPASATRDMTDSSVVHLEFATAFGNGVLNTLTVSNIADNLGNIMAAPASETFSYFLADIGEVFDILINEIFADPSPAVGLPEKEFIELYNNSNKVIDLAGYTFSDATSSASLPAGFMAPGGYLILCANADTNAFKSFGAVMGVSSLPSLNNSGDDLSLRSGTGLLMHSVSYSDTWYNNAFKEYGGWSLEMIDPDNPCAESSNWAACVNANGGTPGKVNSVAGSNPDNQAPVLSRADAIDSLNVLLSFNEPIDSMSLATASYAINNGIGILSDTVMSSKTIKLVLAAELQLNVVYTVTVSGASDCVGNLLGADNTAVFALPEQGLPGDLIINEILSDPVESGSDFIEIYNNSDRFINLDGWQLAAMGADTIDDFEPIASSPYVLFPGDYVMLSTDTANIKETYPLAHSSSFLQMDGFPTYSNDDGTVILINNLLEVSDSFTYDVSMHFSLLNDEDGVSLERLDFNRSAYEKTNWHSAAEAVGFATPGYLNSQFNPADSVIDEISVNPEVFSPDNDGFDDVVNISYQFDTPGFVGSIYIYDSRGRLVKGLVENDLLGTTGTYTWDGTMENGEKGRIGIYVIFFEAFGIEGEIKNIKKSCVLAGRL
ncbi:MAG TPA: hypothetical protein EYN71_11485 [Flavobacteriales bacterium]|nr:hypothetical protein [Flavobacteriales bacterium]